MAITAENDSHQPIYMHQCFAHDSAPCTVLRGQKNNQIFWVVLNSVLDESIKQKLLDESCFAARPVSHLNRVYSFIVPQAHAGLRPAEHNGCKSKIEMESHSIEDFRLRLWNNNSGKETSIKLQKGPLPTLGNCGGTDGALAVPDGKKFVVSQVKNLERFNHASLLVGPDNHELYLGAVAGYREDTFAPSGSRTTPEAPSAPVDFFDDASH